MTELERQLVELGRLLEVPQERDLTAGLAAELAPRRVARPRTRRLALAAAGVAVAALLAVLAIPPARAALLRLLHIGGTEVRQVETVPPAPPLDPRRQLGQQITLEEARARFRRPLRVLAEPADAVYSQPEIGTIWLVYGSLDAVRLLVGQTPGRDEAGYAVKLAGRDSRVEEVMVNGREGVFISGAPHLVTLVSPSGERLTYTSRRAGDVLAWAENGVSYRIEGEFDLARALALARSLRPVGSD